MSGVSFSGGDFGGIFRSDIAGNRTRIVPNPANSVQENIHLFTI